MSTDALAEAEARLASRRAAATLAATRLDSLLERLESRFVVDGVDAAPTFECSICEDRGWILRPAPDPTCVGRTVQAARRCSCRVEAPIEVRLERAGVWEKYRGCSLANFEGNRPARKIEALFTAGGTMPIYGPVGTGKTHLAVGIFREWLAAGRPGRWIDAGTWLEGLKLAFDGDGTSANAQVEELQQEPFLAIDELVARTDWEATTLSRLLRYRDGRELRTLATFNSGSWCYFKHEHREKTGGCSYLAPTLAAVDAIDPRLSSRWAGWRLAVILDGPDRRLEGKR